MSLSPSLVLCAVLNHLKMGNFSKYFNEAVKTKSCSDFFHPGRTCSEAKLDLIPKLLFGAGKYFLPIFLIPALAKFELTKEYFVKQGVLAAKTVLGGFLPAFIAISAFCGLYDHLKNHYFQFYGLPVSIGVLLAAITLPASSVNVLASGGVNHLIEFILEASKGTILYGLKSNVMVGTLTFMTLSSTIVYLFRTCRYRPFWLLHVPQTSKQNYGSEDGESPSSLSTTVKKCPRGWMDYIVSRKKKFCSHQEETCEGFLWQVRIQVFIKEV